MPDQDQIIDAAMVRSIQADVERARPSLAWAVGRDEEAPTPEVSGTPGNRCPDPPYVLLADTLGELHGQLPAGLARSDRQPADPPEVLEIWFLPAG
jgi:hypothetical protein